jgi:hypothetical protein
MSASLAKRMLLEHERTFKKKYKSSSSQSTTTTTNPVSSIRKHKHKRQTRQRKALKNPLKKFVKQQEKEELLKKVRL